MRHVERAARAAEFQRAGRHAAAERLLRDVAGTLSRREAWSAAARVLVALARLLLTGTGSLRRTVNKNQGFPPKSAHKEPFLQWLQSHDENEPWVERLAAIRRSVS